MTYFRENSQPLGLQILFLFHFLTPVFLGFKLIHISFQQTPFILFCVFSNLLTFSIFFNISLLASVWIFDLCFYLLINILTLPYVLLNLSTELLIPPTAFFISPVYFLYFFINSLFLLKFSSFVYNFIIHFS